MQVAVDIESCYCIFMFWNGVFTHSTIGAEKQIRNNVTNFKKVKPVSRLHEVLHHVDWNLEGGQRLHLYGQAADDVNHGQICPEDGDTTFQQPIVNFSQWPTWWTNF
jgi:hypothetical protein